MSPATKPSADAGGSSDRNHRPPPKDSDESSCCDLWVNNLLPDTSGSDLMAAFSAFSPIDATPSPSPRTYAFVHFRSPAAAKTAKDSLSGAPFRGKPMQIDFARPPKQSKRLWVGGLGPAVTERLLQQKFSKFGKIEEFVFVPDRNSAFLDFGSTDEAAAAKKEMDGKRVSGAEIRVDFQRPFQWSRGSKRPLSPPLQPPQRGAPPSNTLWVGYPHSVRMDEQMLHNAMILFGEIERIKSFPERHYCFVEFRSVDEARRAKDGLQGRLFGDPRIQILFSRSDFAPGKDSAPLLPGFPGQRPEMMFDPRGHLLPLPPPGGMPGMNVFIRPYLQQGFDPDFGRPNWGRPSPGPGMIPSSSGIRPGIGSTWDDGFDPDFGRPNRGRPSPGPGMIPSSLGIRPGIGSTWDDGFDPDFGRPNRGRGSPDPGMIPSSSGIRPGIGSTWDDGFDMREHKRSRMYDDEPYYGRRLDDEPVHHDPSQVRRSPDIEHVWRGIIAKGGAHVCQARCVPVGKGLDFTLPEVVNCSARTDLDALAKHYAEAIGFDIVFFIPDSEDDFASYTEFLRYLGLKSRAGVAKFDDGATMFLVPPSDFLTHVLKVSGPERLYGIVLKLRQQQPTTATPQRLQAASLPPPHHGEQQRGSISNDGYGYIPPDEDPAFRTDYGSNMRENSISRAWHGEPCGDVPCAAPLASHDYQRNPEATSRVGVSLTPELIATLASLIPSNNRSWAAGNIQTPASSAARSSSAMNDSSIFAQGWTQQDQVTYSGAQVEMANNTHQQPQQHQDFGGQQQPQQFSHQYGNQPPHMSQYPTYGSTQGEDAGLNMPQISYESYSTHETIRAPDTGVVFNQHLQYQSAPTNASAEGQAGRVMQTQMTLPSYSDNANYSAHMQQLLNASNNSGEGPSQGTDDKNQRYQSTLLFAASLLEKLKQDQGGSENVDGSGNQ